MADGWVFKVRRRVPGHADRDGKLELMKTVCAFTNGDGNPF